MSSIPPNSHSQCHPTFRDATADDLPLLAQLRPPLALHRDRLAQAAGDDLRFLVAQCDSSLAGFSLLVFRRPACWNDPLGQTLLPAVCDLWIRPQSRSQGIGGQFVRHMATLARQRSGRELHLGVDPIDNPRAHAFYLRLGFRPLDQTPHRDHWRFLDSDGQVHEGSEWSIQMVLDL